jgi:uncharacterized protein
MLCTIDSYMFDLNGTNFEALKRSVNFNFSSVARVGNFNAYQSVGKYEEEISIEGSLIAKSQSQIKKFELMAQKKEQHILAFTDGTYKKVIIKALEVDKSLFIPGGASIRQDYRITLSVVGG